MIRKLGLAALALVAITAVSAMAASSASAAGKFECAVAPCIVTGTSEAGTKAKFSASGITMECTAHFAGTSPVKSSAELTMNAEYTTGTCNQEAHIRMNHCDLVLKSNTVNNHGAVSINCEGGTVIEWETTTPHCLLTFGTQNPAGGLNYTNVSEKTVTASWTISKTKFTRHNPTGGFLCGLIPASGEGTYQATDTITCYEDNSAHVGDNTSRVTTGVNTPGEGAQVNCKHNALG